MVFREGTASAVPKNAQEKIGFSPCGSIYEIGSINGLSKRMRVLFIGDIVGSPGRQIVRDRLADIVAQRQIDLVIANGENSASGFGITPRLAEELLGLGIEVLTGGNHSWDRRKSPSSCRTNRVCCARPTFPMGM